MIIPDLTGVAQALKEAFITLNSTPPSSTPLTAPSDGLAGPSRTRGRASALLQAAISADRAHSVMEQAAETTGDLEKRQSVLIGVPIATTRTTTSRSTSTIVSTITQGGMTLTSASSKIATVTKTVTQSPTTGASGSSTTASASLTGTASANATPTPAAKSSGSNVGAIVGGVVGGIVALMLLLALLAFFVRRHRKKVDARREKRNVSHPILNNLNKQYYDDPQNQNTSGHYRSGSIADDRYEDFHVPSNNKSAADHFGKRTAGEQIYQADPYVRDPGARAQGGIGITKAGILRPPQMLDSTPIHSVGSKPAIHKSGSRSSMFVEHVNYEMEDTSTRRSPQNQESPILGRDDAQSIRDVPPAHIMAWNRPDASSDAPISANLTPRTPLSARMKTTRSPDASGQAREANLIVSPLRRDDTDRASEASILETLGSGVYKG